MSEEKATGVVGLHSKAVLEGTAVRKTTHGRGIPLVVAGGIAILAVAGLFWGYSIFSPNGESPRGVSFAVGLLIGLLLIIGSSIVPKFKEFEKAPAVVRALGILVVILSIASSSYGLWFTNLIERGGDCLAHQDCGPRADDFPIINGGTFRVSPNGERATFYAAGKVRLPNSIGRCLSIAPIGVFHITWTRDAANYFIEPKSGKKELATVTSLPASKCRKN